MAIVTIPVEFNSTIPADRMFKCLILDRMNSIPKLMHQVIKKAELIEGNEGPGSIHEITFAKGENMKHFKHRLDAIDKDNLAYSYTVFEENGVLEKVESVSHEIKFEPNANGGCKAKNVCKYHPKLGVEIKEDDFKTATEEALAIFKVVDAYLVANPGAYA